MKKQDLREIKQVLFNQKTTGFLFSICEPINTLKLSYKSNITHNHATKLIQKFERLGLVKRKIKNGREKTIFLTERGKEIQIILKKCLELCRL